MFPQWPGTMPSGVTRAPANPPRLWCIQAKDAPIVAVLARVTGPPRWSCVLKWDVARGRVQEGAWTKLRFKDRSCAISPDGRFLMYVAKGPLKGLFNAYLGGGIAVSRLPWLAALTDILPGSVMGGGPSRHALTKADQEKLWALFEDQPGYYRDGKWPAHFGSAWVRDDAERYSPEERARRRGTRPVRLSAHAALAGRGLRLVLTSTRSRRDSDSGERVRFSLEAAKPLTAAGTLRHLAGVRWAAPTRDGRILVATDDGHLQCLVPTAKGDPQTPLRVDQDHDLTRLKPDPRPAPKGATEPL
ncbi:MAG: hypothetical protein ACKVU4_05880 [Phycisphaerales bacterium]